MQARAVFAGNMPWEQLPSTCLRSEALSQIERAAQPRGWVIAVFAAAMAATNKCLAQNNKSRHVISATKDTEWTSTVGTAEGPCAVRRGTPPPNKPEKEKVTTMNTMRRLLLATALAVTLVVPAQAQSRDPVGECYRQGAALGYATGDRKLGYRYSTSCSLSAPFALRPGFDSTGRFIGDGEPSPPSPQPSPNNNPPK
jgi:hypothetical protein